MGWGAAAAEGAPSSAVAAAAAAAVSTAAVFLARLDPNMSLLSGGCRWGVARVWGVVHGGRGTDPRMPGRAARPQARTRNPRLPMREPPRGLSEGKPSVGF